MNMHLVETVLFRYDRVLYAKNSPQIRILMPVLLRGYFTYSAEFTGLAQNRHYSTEV